MEPKFFVGTVSGNPACIYDAQMRPLGECSNVITAEVICRQLNEYVAALEQLIAAEDADHDQLRDAFHNARKVVAR